MGLCLYIFVKTFFFQKSIFQMFRNRMEFLVFALEKVIIDINYVDRAQTLLRQTVHRHYLRRPRIDITQVDRAQILLLQTAHRHYLSRPRILRFLFLQDGHLVHLAHVCFMIRLDQIEKMIYFKVKSFTIKKYWFNQG